MPAPMVAASNPISVELEQGKENFYCPCGRSADQPFCDGSHQGTGFSPLAFVAETSGSAVMCRCKQTATSP
jgi:CDGSH-type Zn-finger protein